MMLRTLRNIELRLHLVVSFSFKVEGAWLYTLAESTFANDDAL